ncbi:hypothetical protein KZX46_03540 (plasmid) [Polymorphobacter sp. PAMC 29334]|uniref:hypothetical protein n=1 Tax=Polymorphobacter sp. PAMC 29334 TaxID=2862331 RepID=UPI001C75E750|nr:hypothetical protein [Polymorphobacter sp. PAMC 29334]QYE33194.1 hypothetical protein KZX46_03540 [Polymorphobacter sp. PAMC 29334]
MATSQANFSSLKPMALKSQPQLAFSIAIFFVAIIPLIVTPLFPFIDLYNHLARYYVLGHLETDGVLRANYTANWALLPNIGLDVIGTVMMRFVPKSISAQLIVILLFAVQYCGVLAFNRALTGRTSLLVALLIVPLLYSYILNWGFASFLFGLGLVFLAAAWWVARRHRLVVALPIACLLAVAIFFVHGLTFAIYGLLVASLEIGRVWQAPGRRLNNLIRALLPVVIQALVPTALFLSAPTSETPGGVSNAGASIARLAQQGTLGTRLWELFDYRILTIVRVAEGPWLWLDLLTFVALVLIIATLVVRKRVAIIPVAWPAIGVAASLVVLVPPAMFGVGYVADRMPLFLALLAVGSISVQAFCLDVRRATWAVGSIVLLRLCAITIGWQEYAADYADFQRISLLIPRGSLVHDLIVGDSRRGSSEPRCAMYRPLLIRDYGQVGALFSDEYKQPLALKGQVRAAVRALSAGVSDGTHRGHIDNDPVSDTGRAGFDFVLMCGAQPRLRPLPSRVTVVARTERFMLLDVRALHFRRAANTHN